MKLKFDFDSGKNRLVSVKIFGDFFCHPENSIELIESFLTGRELNQFFVLDLERFIKLNSIELFGFQAKDLLDAITLGLNGGKNA